MDAASGDELLGTLASDPDAPAPPAPAPATATYLVFRLGEGWFAVEAQAVQEVVPATAPVPVPGVPAFVAGVVNLAGRIIVQVDLGMLLGQARGRPRSEEELGIRCLILQVDRMPFALVADEVAGLMDVAASALRLPAGGAQDLRLTLESFALESKVVTVVDVRAVLAHAEASVGTG